ncbi:MAG: PepSY-associated TM helix domain-containing protein [Desulfobacterales bacterium]|nr:PepSY-associated TM helix domain-containing protein [Desulfobacterales bacterium]
MKKISWRKLHRWAGLLLTGFVVFYCLTGLLLNHRQDFAYFQERRKSVVRIKAQDQKSLPGFINTYKQQINRSDDPTVIRIRQGGVIEFLYGSHGRTTYVIDPRAGTMTRIDKADKQPWYWLNRLHKAYKTSTAWQLLTDAVALLVIFLALTGLIIFRYTRQDILLLTGGLLLLLLGMLAA